MADAHRTTRRAFLRQSAVTVASGLAASLAVERTAHAAGSDAIRLGLVGCGGRGAGAAQQALRADPGTRLVAMTDAFDDRVENSLRSLRQSPEVGERVTVDRDHRFVGFDGYQRVLESGVDVVLLATPPQFRPRQLAACVAAGKHVFAEKPVAVDAPGVRSALASTELARRKGLSLVAGLNSRYSPILQEAVRRVHEGGIGRIVALHTARYGSGVWVRPRESGMTEMQYQMRNWYYFTWLSGDFNVEMFVHQLDQMAWLMQDQYPIRCYSTGGRQARTGPDHGHIYDHFSTVYEYAGGARLFSTTRHQPGCSTEGEAYALGTEGVADLAQTRIAGAHPWQAPRGARVDTHQLEQDAFFQALRAGRVINNGDYLARSTMMAIMARQSAYTGQSLTWEQALNSQEDLSPTSYSWDAQPPPSPVAIPGVTKFI
ncbi:MAG: Gfo/Idh/MocA family oxidoreductase [Verrucomicrobia bacterium]|nr:Gfo/Idh/MocA family oxidoreductase [Verrucomicrobiota bacterium]